MGGQGDRLLPKSEKLPKSENPYLEVDLVRSFSVRSLAPSPSMLSALSASQFSPVGGLIPPGSPRWWPLHSCTLRPWHHSLPRQPYVMAGSCMALPSTPLPTGSFSHSRSSLQGPFLSCHVPPCHQGTTKVPSSCVSDLHSCTLLPRTP